MSDIETELNAKIDIELKRNKEDKDSGDEKGKNNTYRNMTDYDLVSGITESLATLQTIVQLVQKNNIVMQPPLPPSSSGVLPVPPMQARIVDEDIASLSKKLLYEQTNVLFQMVKALVEKDVR
jgi:hypothetical protein